jgi:ElaB/YqjD/DUF883 family membrane-anchored ribosome-binding protein
MDEGTREGSPQLREPETNDETKTPEAQELRRDIAETREELGETVEALAHKTDVKGQAKAKVDEVRGKVAGATPEQARGAAAQVTERVKKRPAPSAAVGALLFGIVIGWMLARR